MSYLQSRILFVDNDPQSSDWIGMMLRGGKIDAIVVRVNTGLEALRWLGDEEFDLCILDYALPDMTGVQLCSLMRQLRYAVPVMFFTALDRPVDRQQAAEAGASDFLSKPDDLDIFADATAHLLKKRRKIFGEIYTENKHNPVFAKAA